jgi:carbon storage regulator
MLISRRKEGETVLIGDDIEIRVVSVRKKKVILGIIAPRDVRIVATRMNEAELENTLAAAHSLELPNDKQEEVVFLLERSTPLTDKTSGVPARS